MNNTSTINTRPAETTSAIEQKTSDQLNPVANTEGFRGDFFNMPCDDLLASIEKLNHPEVGVPKRAEKAGRMAALTPIKRLCLRSNYCDLVDASPNLRELNTPKEYLERLFPTGSMVCVGTDYGNCKTAPLDEFGDLWGARCIVPSPMTAREGYTVGDPENGVLPRLTSRSKANTGRALYIVYRGRLGGLEVQAASIILLARYAPLTMVVEADRDKMEAWYYVGDRTVHNIRKCKSLVNSSGSGGCSSITCQPYCLPLGIKHPAWCLGLLGDQPLDTKPEFPVERNRVLYFDPPTTFNYRG